jgi:hypothetical protein
MLPSRRAQFDPLAKPRPHGLFTQDPAFWRTVHLGGDGYEEQLAQQAAAAKAAWADKVVVKDIHFHGLPGTGDKASSQVIAFMLALGGGGQGRGQVQAINVNASGCSCSSCWCRPKATLLVLKMLCAMSLSLSLPGAISTKHPFTVSASAQVTSLHGQHICRH